jgi:uncharacterized protein YaaQ
MAEQAISTLFLDIGGVLGTNGWDRRARQRAAAIFGLDYAEMDERHHLTFDTYEEGKLSLDEYLDRVVFYAPRPFTRQVFRDFMFAQSQPYPDTLALIHDLKDRFGLKVAVVSNDDVRSLLSALIETGHRATKLASTGGFLRKGNTTLLLGVNNDDVENVLSIMRTTCRRRSVPYPFQLSEHPGMIPHDAIEVEVGGATVFVIPVERFAHF